jgi:polyisoprenoid-binding protein YceI
MKTFVRSFVVVLPLLFASSVLAQHQTFTVSPESSDVSFTLLGSDHGTHGTFHVKNGSIDFDRSAPQMSGTVVVAAGSGKTGNDSRDKKMTETVLDSPHFAEVSFVPKSYLGMIATSWRLDDTGCRNLHAPRHIP